MVAGRTLARIAFVGSALLVLACRKTSTSTRAEGDRGDAAAEQPWPEAGPPMFGALGGSRRLDTPADCRTALLETTSCHGEDTSFQECHYYFRADGVPRAEVCRAFLNVAANARTPDAGGDGCNELSPAEWKRVPCADYKLPTDFACFYCASYRHETGRELVQAFTPACDRGIVLKGCNIDIAHTAVP